MSRRMARAYGPVTPCRPSNRTLNDGVDERKDRISGKSKMEERSST